MNPRRRNLNPRRQVFQKDELFIASADHPMIPDKDQAHILKNTSALQPVYQPPDPRDRLGDLRIVGADPVTLVIGVLEVEGHEHRDLVGGEVEVAQDGINPVLERHRAIVVAAEIGRAGPVTFDDLRAGPEVGGGGEAVGGDGFPDGAAEPPLGVVGLHGEEVAGDVVVEVVVDDAVVGGVEAGGDGVVVGEGEGGEDGDEAGGGLGAVGDEAGEVRGRGLELVPKSEAVGGDEEDDRAG